MVSTENKKTFPKVTYEEIRMSLSENIAWELTETDIDSGVRIAFQTTDIPEGDCNDQAVQVPDTALPTMTKTQLDEEKHRTQQTPLAGNIQTY